MEVVLGCVVPGSAVLYRIIQETTEPLTTLHDGVCTFVHATQKEPKLSPKSAVKLFLAVRDGKWLSSSSPEVAMLMDGARLDRGYWTQPIDLSKTIGDYFKQCPEPRTINIVVDWWDESLVSHNMFFEMERHCPSESFAKFLSPDGKTTHYELRNLTVVQNLVENAPLDRLGPISNVVMMLREEPTDGVKRSEAFALLCRRWFRLNSGNVLRFRSLSEQIDFSLPRDLRLVEFTSLDQFVCRPVKMTMFMPKRVDGQLVSQELSNIDAFIIDGRGVLYWLEFAMDTRRFPKTADLASVITIFRPAAVKIVYVTPMAHADAFPRGPLPEFSEFGGGEQYLLGVREFAADLWYP